MKINEVEAQVGITKKNIRFYEEQGLIAPRRNSENGYREYGPREVDQLRQVKLLRKLGVPLEEIRKMQSGTHTVGDGMRRHLVTLERDGIRKIWSSPSSSAALSATGTSGWTTWTPLPCWNRWTAWSGRAPPSSTNRWKTPSACGMSPRQ